jgi:hypothetical protein
MTHSKSTTPRRPTEHDIELVAFREACQRYIDFLDQSYLTGRNTETFDGWTVTIAATGQEISEPVLKDEYIEEEFDYEAFEKRWLRYAALDDAAERMGTQWATAPGDCWELRDRLQGNCLGVVRKVDERDWGAFSEGHAMFFDDVSAAREALLEMVTPPSDNRV